MENTPEVPKLNPTKASWKFLSDWARTIILCIGPVNVGLWGGLAGMDLAMGNNESALTKGIVAGGFGVATILEGLSMVFENKDLKDEVNQLRGLDKN